jgi:ABC-type polysaccharide/polyol phosphate export permease
MIIVSAGLLVRYALSVLAGRTLATAEVATIAVKSIPWAFFVASIRFSSMSLISNSNLVTKIYFPKIIFPIASVFSQVVDFALSASVLVIVLFVLQVGLSWHLLWAPLLLLILILLVTGIGILLSAANLFFRDVKYIVEILLTFAIFFTPVLYDISLFEEKGTILLLNPIAPILEGLNDCIVLHSSPSAAWTLYSGLVSLVIFVSALRVFRVLEPRFAESI